MSSTIWVSHRTKPGETLQSLVKLYKIKDPETILRFSGNRKCASLLKAGGPLPARTLVWIPNPKGKMHIVDGLDGRLVLDEQQYKEYLKNVHATMDRVSDVMTSELGYAAGRHDDQKSVNNDQWFVSSVVGLFSRAEEPTKLRKDAEAAVKALTAAAKSRNYNKFSAASERAEEALVRYQNAVNKWTGDLIGTAEGTVKNLKIVKKAGEFCGTVVAVTVAAPASIPAAILIGGGASGGVGLAYDGFDQIGRVAGGVKPRSLGDLGSRLIKNTLTGAGSALIAGALLKYVGGPLVKALMSRASLTKHASKLAERVVVQRVFEKEANILADQLAKKGSKISAEQYIKILTHDRIKIQAMTKFLVRTGNAGLLKHLEAGNLVEKQIESWVKINPDKAAGKDRTAVAQAVAREIANSKASEQIFNDYLEAHMADFRKDLVLTLQAHAMAAEKNAK